MISLKDMLGIYCFFLIQWVSLDLEVLWNYFDFFQNRGLADTGTRIPLFMKNVMPPDTIEPRPKILQQSTRFSNQDKNN